MMLGWTMTASAALAVIVSNAARNGSLGRTMIVSISKPTLCALRTICSRDGFAKGRGRNMKGSA
jgi:hypothetical protein